MSYVIILLQSVFVGSFLYKSTKNRTFIDKVLFHSNKKTSEFYFEEFWVNPTSSAFQKFRDFGKAVSVLTLGSYAASTQYKNESLEVDKYSTELRHDRIKNSKTHNNNESLTPAKEQLFDATIKESQDLDSSQNSNNSDNNNNSG